MDARNFYYLLQTADKLNDSRAELCHYCLLNFKRRMIMVHGVVWDSDKLNEMAHELLVKFLKSKPKHFVFAPFKYINQITDNFMAQYYKNKSINKKVEVPLNKDIPYEQNFNQLDKIDIYKFLLYYLDERSAKIVYLTKIEEMGELEVASKMNISYANVRTIMSRAIKKLKIIMKDVTNLKDWFS